jgi:nitroimidazol reductase NimA-like FMN-containing flavoprotein (pyridoxamine 5'-phosphate oxidase superfamily)
MLTIENPATFAAEAGFQGERAVYTWRRRMKSLRDFGFITTKSGASGEFHYVLLLNPNVAVEALHRRNLVPTSLYGRFVERVADIGAFGEIEAIRTYWKAQEELAAAAQAATNAKPETAATKGRSPRKPSTARRPATARAANNPKA